MSNRLTIKGQVTIPKSVRDFLGLTAGASAIDFSIDDDGSVRIRKADCARPRSAAGRAPASPAHLARPGDYSACDRVLALLSGSFA